MQLTSRNTNTLQPLVYDLLRDSGVADESRNGPVLRFPEPVLIQLTSPWERVNFCPFRDANPFFHLLEAVAMLGAVNDIKFLAHFASNMLNYSDDGETQNAFYGTRLRKTYGNQLDDVIRNLMENPTSRQEVALSWHPDDLRKKTKDKACNLLLMFSIDLHNQVEMTSINRSNDAIWGFVSGANIVHLSIFHEYVARSLGRMMGSWWHFSNNLHVYTANPKWEKLKYNRSVDLYQGDRGDELTVNRMIPLFEEPDQKRVFDQQVTDLLSVMVGAEAWKKGQCISVNGALLPFLNDVRAMFNAWQMYKTKHSLKEIDRHLTLHVRADDWRIAATQWMERRAKSPAHI